MKKKITAVVCACLLAFGGCKKTVNPAPPFVQEDPERPENLKDLPYEPHALVEYIRQNLAGKDAETRELYLYTLEDTLALNLPIVGNIIWERDVEQALEAFRESEFVTASDIDQIPDPSIRSELQRIDESLYKIQSTPPTFNPVIDYERIVQLDDHMIASQKEYFLLKAEEIDRPLLVSGEVAVTPDDLLKRLNRMEAYLRAYPESVRSNEVLDRYQYSLFVLLTGTTLSPIADKNGQLKPDYAALYERLSEPNTTAEKLFVRGIRLLETRGFSDDETTLETIRNLVQDSTHSLRTLIEVNRQPKSN